MCGCARSDELQELQRSIKAEEDKRESELEKDAEAAQASRVDTDEIEQK